jgi:hypothetical protein
MVLLYPLYYALSWFFYSLCCGVFYFSPGVLQFRLFFCFPTVGEGRIRIHCAEKLQAEPLFYITIWTEGQVCHPAAYAQRRGGARRIRIRIFRHWTCLAGRTHRQNISFPLINPWETCDSLCLSLIHFFQLSATAEPLRAAPDGNRALFSSPKRENASFFRRCYMLEEFCWFFQYHIFSNWCQGHFPLGEAVHSTQASAEVKKTWICTPTHSPICLYDVVLN